MGLDAVEIVLAVEDAFDIHIEDAEAEKLLTPRRLIDFIQTKVSSTTTTFCLTQRAFNLLRKALLKQGRWKRREIAPAIRLAALFPRPQRKAEVEKLAFALGIPKPPEFVRARWVNLSLLMVSLGAGLLAAMATGHSSPFVKIWGFMGVAMVTAGIALRLTRPLCTEFPSNLQTVGDLASWVMTRKPDLARAGVTAWTRDQIAARVREIIVETLNCRPDFSEDASFVKDLGLS